MANLPDPPWHEPPTEGESRTFPAIWIQWFKNLVKAVNDLVAAGTGGLLYWIEARSTTAPNATVNVSSFTPNTSSADADASIVPKGAGALLAAVPDGATAGGNKRGAGAVDLQTKRGAATEVASGVRASIGGGGFNLVDEQEATVVGGYNNYNHGLRAVEGGASNLITSAGSYATVFGNGNTVSNIGGVAIGQTNVVSGANGVAFGAGHVVSGQGGFAVGESNAADAAYSLAVGFKSIAGHVTGARAYACGQLFAAGDAQEMHYTLRRTTSNATPIFVGTDTGGVPFSGNQMFVPGTNGVVSVEGHLVAKSALDCAKWHFDALFQYLTGPGLVMLQSNMTVVYATAGAAAWALAISADTANNRVALTATGAAATTINWVGSAWTVVNGS